LGDCRPRLYPAAHSGRIGRHAAILNQPAARKALSQELTAEHRSANRLLAAKRRHPLLVGGARSGKAFVSFVASWRAA
jgi:hypothetical protein